MSRQAFCSALILAAVVPTTGCSEARRPEKQTASRPAAIPTKSPIRADAPAPHASRRLPVADPITFSSELLVEAGRNSATVVGTMLAAGDPDQRRLRDDASNPHSLILSTGEIIDAREIFSFDRSEAEEQLKRQGGASRLLTMDYPSGAQWLRLGRSGSFVHGVTLASYENGDTMAYATYSKGERDGDMMLWDEAGRPMLFAQYNSGKRDGFLCLFKECKPSCRPGHLLMAQEWESGRLLKTHIVSDGDFARTVDHEEDELPVLTDDDAFPVAMPDDTVFAMALEEVGEIEQEISENEKEVAEWVANYANELYRKKKQARLARAAKARRRAVRSRGARGFRFRFAGIKFGGGGGRIGGGRGGGGGGGG